jgi:hypothetical protein
VSFSSTQRGSSFSCLLALWNRLFYKTGAATLANMGYNVHCLRADERIVAQDFYSMGQLRAMTEKFDCFDPASHWGSNFYFHYLGVRAACLEYNYFSDVPLIGIVRGRRKMGAYIHWWRFFKSCAIADAIEMRQLDEDDVAKANSRVWQTPETMARFLAPGTRHTKFKEQMEHEAIPLISDKLALEQGCHGTLVYRRKVTWEDVLFSGIRTLMNGKQTVTLVDE